MTVTVEALPISDDLWNALFSNQPDACRLHRCWTDQCPAGGHDETDDEAS
jgi:hypothetical protein